MLHQMEDQDLRNSQDTFVMTEFNRQDKINEPIRLLLCKRYEEFHEILMRLYSSNAPFVSYRKIESFDFLKMREGQRIEGILDEQLAELIINAQGTPRYLEHDSQLVLHRFIRRLYFDKKHSLPKCSCVLKAYDTFARKLTHVDDVSEFLKNILEASHPIREEMFNEVQKLFVQPQHRRTSVFENAYSRFDEEQKLILELAYNKFLEALGRLNFDWAPISARVMEKLEKYPYQRLINHIGKSCIIVTNLKLNDQLTKGKIIPDFEKNTYEIETDQIHKDIRGQQTIRQLLSGIYAGSYLKMLSQNPVEISQNTLKLKYRLQFLDKMLHLLSEDELDLLPDIQSFGKLVQAFKSMLDHHKYKFISVSQGSHNDQFYNVKYISKVFVLIQKLYAKEEETSISQLNQGLFLHWVRVLNEWIIYYKLQQQPYIQKAVESIFNLFFSGAFGENGEFADFPSILDENSELSQEIKKLIIGLDNFPRSWEACKGFKTILFGWGVGIINQTPEMQIILEKFLASVFSNENTVASANYSLDFFESPSVSKVFKKMVSSQVLKCIQRQASSLIKDGVSSKKHEKYFEYSNFISKIAMIIATKMPFEYIDRIVRNVYQIYINCAHVWSLLGCFRLWILQIYQEPNDNHLQKRLKQVQQLFHQFSVSLDQDIDQNNITIRTSELFERFQNVAYPLINCMHLKKNKQAYSEEFYKRYFAFILHVEEKNRQWVKYWAESSNQYRSWVALGVNLQFELSKIKTELKLNIRYYLCNSTKLLNYNEEDTILRQITSLYSKIISQNGLKIQTWKLLNSFLGFNERNYKSSLLQSKQLLGNHHRYTSRFNPTLKIDDFAPFNFFSCLYSYIRPHFSALLRVSFEAIYSNKVNNDIIWQNLEKILFMPVIISGSCLFNGKHHSKTKQEMVFGIYGQQYKIMSEILTQIKEGSKMNITIVLQLQKRKILSKLFDAVKLKTTKIIEKARNIENINRFRARQAQSPEQIFQRVSQLGIQPEYIEIALRNVEIPDENQVLNWIDNHRDQLEEQVLNQAMRNSSGLQRRGISQTQPQEKSGNSIPQLNLQAFKKQINGNPLKNWVRFIFKELFQNTSMDQIHKIRDILFMFLQFFETPTKIKQFKNLNDKIYGDLDALNKEDNIQLKLTLLISIMQTLSDKHPPSKVEFYKKSINMKVLSFLDKLKSQEDKAKIFGLINAYLPVITPEILSPEMQRYLEYLLDATFKFKIADKNITQIFLKIAKSNKQSLIERITRNIVQYLASGLISENIVPIIQIIFESDKELSLVNAQLDLKSYIYQRYLHVINSFHPEKEHVIDIDGTQMAENFSKYEKDSAIYQVSKKILRKNKNKNRHFCYDCRIEQNAFDYSSYLKAPFISARLKGYQQTIVRSLLSILFSSPQAQQEQLLVQLHKILSFYRILIPFALKQRVNNTNLLEWLINSPNNSKRKYKLLLFLCLNNNIFIRASENSLYSYYSIADYSCSKIIEIIASRSYENEEYHPIISCLYLQQVRKFSDFSEVQFDKENTKNLVTFLQNLILKASPAQQLVISQILNIQYKKRLINNLKRKYKIALSEKQPTFMRQFLSLSSFYSSLAIKTFQERSKIPSNPIGLAGRWNHQRQNSESDEQQENEQRPIIFQLNDGGPQYPARRALIGAEPDAIEQFLIPIYKKQQKEKEVDPAQLVPVVITYNYTIFEIINRFEQYLNFEVEVPEKFNVPEAVVPQSIVTVGENIPFKIVIPEGHTDIEIRINKNFNFQKRFSDLAKVLDPTSSWQQKKSVSPQDRRLHEFSRRIFSQDPNMTQEYRHQMLQQLERLVASRQNRLGQPPQQNARLININQIYSQSVQFTAPIRPVLPPKQEKMVIQQPIKAEQIKSNINQQVQVVQNQQVVQQIPIQPVVNNLPAQYMDIEEPVPLVPLVPFENPTELLEHPALIIQEQAPIQIQPVEQAPVILPPEPQNLVPEIDRQILRVFNLPQTFLRDAGIDQFAFDCLPEQLQQEQLMQIISQQNRAPNNPPQNRNPAQQGQQGNQAPVADQLHQNVLFLAGLDYQTRVQVLIEANPQFLATLPQTIRQEAEALRHHQISRLMEEEDLREEEKRVETVKQRLKLPPPKIYKQQFSTINDGAAKKIFEGVLFVIPNFKITALKILLENKQTQSKTIMSIIGFLRYLQSIKNKRLYRLKKVIKEEKKSRIIQTFDWSEQDIKNIRLSLLHTIYQTFKIPTYQDEEFLTQTVQKQFYLEELASFFGQEEVIDPKIQLLQHSLRYYPALSCELIKKLKDLPDNILKRLVEAMKNDTLPDEFYPNLQNFSNNERLRAYFAAAFQNEKPKIQILGKVLKYNFSHLPNLRKIHQQALEYFSNSYYEFLNQIFRIYTLQSIVDIEPILTKHKQIHFQVIKYLLQTNKEIDKEPIGILLKKPHLLDFQTKKFIFRNHPKIRKLSRHRVHIEVDRTHIFQGSYNQLMSRSVRELQGRIQVSFLNEAGYDAGGLKRQWFLIVSREIFNQDYALFQKSSSGSTYQPNPKSYVNPDHLNYFKFIGRFIGKALVERQLIDAYFTRAFYKIILGQQLQFKDLQAQDYQFYKSMEWLKNNPIDADMFTFSYFYDNFGNKVEKEIIPGGKSIIVNEQNKKEFIEKYCLAKMRDDFSAQINKFLEGFYEIIPQQCISFFEAKQLQLLMSGVPEVDLQDLKTNTDYSGYTPTDQIIIWFWEVVEEYSQQSLAKLVQFITGTSKIPVEGFSQIVGMNGIQRISIHRDPNEHQLPKSHTCFNQLDLPNYATKEILREKMAICLAWGSQGFGFM